MFAVHLHKNKASSLEPWRWHFRGCLYVRSSCASATPMPHGVRAFCYILSVFGNIHDIWAAWAIMLPHR